MYFFEDAFEVDKIEPRLPRIFNPVPKDKIAIDVSDLAESFNARNLDPGTDDYTLWKSLAETQMGQKIKEVLRECLTKAGLGFNPLEINKLGKDDCIRLFFYVFDIWPKSGKKTRPEPGSKAELDFWLGKILTDPGKTYSLEEAQIAAFFNGESSLETALASRKPEELQPILSILLEQKGVAFKTQALDQAPKRLLGKIFLRVFGKGSSEENYVTPDQSAVQADPEEIQAEASEPVLEAAEVAISLEEAQAIFNAGQKVPAKEHLERIDVTDVRIFENMPITLKDHVYLLLSEPKRIFAGCVMLANPNTGKVAAAGHFEAGLKKDDNSEETAPHLVFAQKDMDFEELKHQSVFNLVLVPGDQAAFFEQPMTLERANSYSGKLLILEKIHRTFQQLPETDRVLCIDFGTSNTTAGTYGAKGPNDDSVSLVTFQDVTEKKPAVSELLPTMVYVASCAPGRKPEYLFGFEAKKKLIESDYAPEGSFFFEIKRWLNDLDRDEKIEDELGNEVTVRREDIVFAYLKYVITTAEQQFKTRFKKLHFTAPVKQKEIFLEWLKNIFKNTDKEILPAHESLDEGVAIVYYKAINELRRGVEKMDILILDCGGGTTDLANCKCEYKNNGLTNELTIKTGFENGDSNFGGNNITFRVMQMLKIKIARQLEAMQALERLLASGEVNAEKLEILVDKKVITQAEREKWLAEGFPTADELRENVQKIRIPMEELMGQDENEILRELDSPEDAGGSTGMPETEMESRGKTILDIKNNIYKNFEQAYLDAEKYVPTRFAEYELRDEREMVRRNFYYLWQMAEAIKIKFYKTNIVNMDFAKKESMDTILDLGDMQQYYLAIRKDGAGLLEKRKAPLAHMEITFKEIERILCADVYTLLNTLLNFSNPLDFSYCLSGQSCKIALFHNLLKEFIPGKNMRRGLKSSSDEKGTGSDMLKKYCIMGSIEFNKDKDRGSMKPIFEQGIIKPIYDIYFREGTGDKPMFIPAGKEQKINYMLRPKNTREVKLVVRDKVRVEKNEINYQVFTGEQHKLTLEQLKTDITGKIGLDEDTLERDVFTPLHNLQDKYQDEDFYCFFALPSSHGYGLQIFQIGINHTEDGMYYSLPPDERFEPYENENLLTFFDGKR